MNVNSQKAGFKELRSLDAQIDKTISDIGRLSSYNQSKTDTLSKIKLEKMNFLHSLVEKKTKLIKRLEKHNEIVY